MKTFLIKLSFFLLPVLAYCGLAAVFTPKLLALRHGPSTETQISGSFEEAIKNDYDMYILGNSRTYRGIDPDNLAPPAFNFSHDNDSFNQIYYKLLYLTDNKKDFNYLVLGVDYFQFSFKSDTRNYVYADLFRNEYLKDFKTNRLDLLVGAYLDNLNPKKLFARRNEKRPPVYKQNGQYITYATAKETDAIDRDITRLKLQTDYFFKIIDLCRKKHIKVFMTMMPTRKVELASYTEAEISEFNSFLRKVVDNKSVFLLDFTYSADYKTQDYTDATHLNEKASSRFTKALNDSIVKLIDADQK